MRTRARNKKGQARPYVGDALRESANGSEKAGMSLAFVLLALAVGFVIGFAVFLAMNLSAWLTNLLWVRVGGALNFALFPFVTCTLGGAIIGVWTWWSKDEVRSLEHVISEFNETGSYRTNGAWKPVVTFLLPLVFGGSIGFEAGLTGLITSGCCWIRDQLKRAGLRLSGLDEITIAASMAAIFRTPLAGIAAGAESTPDVDAYDMRRGAKVVLYVAAAFGAFAGIRALTLLVGGSGGLPRFEGITAAPSQVLWALPCIALAYLMTLIFHASKRLFAMVGASMHTSTMGAIARPVVCGIVLGAIACVLPYVLFPGETQCEELMASWTAWTAAALLGTGLLKAALTPMCINMGWIGGDLFPSVFAGVAAGFGLASLTGADPMLMVTVTTATFLAGVVRKPLLVLGILFLCFPADGILWMGIAAVIGSTLPLPRVLEQE